MKLEGKYIFGTTFCTATEEKESASMRALCISWPFNHWNYV